VIADQSPVAEQDAPHIILVVEDEVLPRMMFTDQLRAGGYRVLEASDAEERWRGFVR
jgi:CheY-like chemotaxis protein